MGAKIEFNQMLPTLKREAAEVGLTDTNPRRQLEVLLHGGALSLRLSPVNKEDTGTDRYTVHLSRKIAEDLIDALVFLKSQTAD